MHERALSHSPLICFRNPKILTCTIRPTCLVSAFISSARRLKNTNHQGGHYFPLTLHCNSTCFCRQKWTVVGWWVVGEGFSLRWNVTAIYPQAHFGVKEEKKKGVRRRARWATRAEAWHPCTPYLAPSSPSSSSSSSCMNPRRFPAEGTQTLSRF